MKCSMNIISIENIIYHSHLKRIFALMLQTYIIILIALEDWKATGLSETLITTIGEKVSYNCS